MKMKWHVLFLSTVALALLLSSAAVAEPVQRRDFPAGFMPGMRVVLLADQPTIGSGLESGMAGTIVCCDTADCTGELLVSWDFWNGGEAEADRCANAESAVFPPGSLAWVDPDRVPLAQPFDETGYLRMGLEGCVVLEAENGGVYNIVGGSDLLDTWFVLLPGNYVRIRGLFHKPAEDPDIVRICPLGDGDVYHPIVSSPFWLNTPCCDRWVCGFNYGDRVALIAEDNPYGVEGLPRGSTGTVLCCRGGEERSVLVSWDLFEDGDPVDEYIQCTERVNGMFPPFSTVWMSPLDIAKEVETDCGTLQEMTCRPDDETCPALEWTGLFARRDLFYLPDVFLGGLMPEGDFRAFGLYTPYAILPGLVPPDDESQNPLSGTILNSVLLPCPEPSCCEPAYEQGDRVILMVDEPGGANDLLVGATGTVVCCDPDAPMAPILVSWDDWSDGHNRMERCDCDPEWPIWFTEDSGWWMMCEEIERAILPELMDAGPDYRSFIPSIVEPGQQVKVTAMIANRGGAESGSFSVAVYLSDDKEITRDDFELGKAGMFIFPRGTSELSLTAALPDDFPAGDYYVGWIIDPMNRVEEIIETNNTVVIDEELLTVDKPVAVE